MNELELLPMPLFACEHCHTVENTALSNYACRYVSKPPAPALCSACDPEIRRWHGYFPRTSAQGYWLGSDGFLYSEAERLSGDLEWRMTHTGFTLLSRFPSIPSSPAA